MALSELLPFYQMHPVPAPWMFLCTKVWHTFTDSNFFIFFSHHDYRINITVIESNIPSQISSNGKLCFHFWSSNFRIKFIHFSFFLIQKTENDSSSGGWFHYFSYQEAEKFTMSRVGVTFRTKQSEFFMYPTQVYGLCFNSIHQSESFATQLQGNAGCGFLCKEGTKFFSCCFTYC